MEVPSSHSGVVKELKVKLGDKVSEGAIILVLEAAQAAPDFAPAAQQAPATQAGAPVRSPAALAGA